MKKVIINGYAVLITKFKKDKTTLIASLNPLVLT